MISKHTVSAIPGAKHGAESVPIPGAIGYLLILVPENSENRNIIKGPVSSIRKLLSCTNGQKWIFRFLYLKNKLNSSENS